RATAVLPSSRGQGPLLGSLEAHRAGRARPLVGLRQGRNRASCATPARWRLAKNVSSAQVAIDRPGTRHGTPAAPLRDRVITDAHAPPGSRGGIAPAAAAAALSAVGLLVATVAAIGGVSMDQVGLANAGRLRSAPSAAAAREIPPDF